MAIGAIVALATAVCLHEKFDSCMYVQTAPTTIVVVGCYSQKHADERGGKGFFMGKHLRSKDGVDVLVDKPSICTAV